MNTTRLAPTPNWGLGTAKWHLRRSLKNVTRLGFEAIQTLAAEFLNPPSQAYRAVRAFQCNPSQLTVEPLELGVHLCSGVAIGEFDKQKTSGFII